MKKLLLFMLALVGGVVSSSASSVGEQVPFTYTSWGASVVSAGDILLNFTSASGEYKLTNTNFSISDYPKYRIEYELISGDVQIKVLNKTTVGAGEYTGQYNQLSNSVTAYEAAFNTETFADDKIIAAFNLQAISASASIKLKKISLISSDETEYVLTDGGKAWGMDDPILYSATLKFTGNYACLTLPVADFSETEEVEYTVNFGEALPQELGFTAKYSNGTTDYVWPNIAVGATSATFKTCSTSDKYLTSLELGDKNHAGSEAYNVNISKIIRTRNVATGAGAVISNEEWTCSESWNGALSVGADKFADAKVNDMIIATLTQKDVDGQIIFKDGSTWGNLDGNAVVNLKTTSTSAIYVIPNASVLKVLKTNGLKLQAQAGVTVTKVTLQPTNNSYGAVVATIGDAGYATYVASEDLDFSEVDGLTAYVVSAVSSSVTLSPVTTVAANTGVVLKGDADTYEIPYAASTPAAVTNRLQVSDGNVTGGANIYVLAKKSEVGFYPTSNGITVPEGKCYIDTGVGASEYLGFDFADDQTTGIGKVAAETQADGVFYNLAGQRVAQPAKGLYIVNGKKVIIK